MYIAFAFIGGKLFTILTSHEDNFIKAGLSAYGGLVGVTIASIIFEKILPSKQIIIKYTILSLPLTYSLTKIACFVAGCCHGIPYNGPFSVIYTNGLNIPLFPIQALETICFMVLFIILKKKKENKNIPYISLITISLLKFSLDFLRYDHLTKIVTINQIFSLVLCTSIIMLYLYQKKKKNLIN